MSKYHRMKLELTDISLESTSKIFKCLHQLFDEHRLDLKYFEKSISKYSVGELHFIFYYIKIYFGNEYDNYLDRWFKKIDVEHQIKGDNQLFDLIEENRASLLKYVNRTDKTIERRFKFYKFYKKEFDNISNISTSSKLQYRIPLFFEDDLILPKKNVNQLKINVELFKGKTYEILKEDLFDYNQFELFFNNSFDFKGNFRTIDLLYIEIERFDSLNSKIHKLYQLYQDQINDSIELYMEKYDKTFDELMKKKKEERLKFVKKRMIGKVGRFEFMKIMYNAFPQIRDSYEIYIKKNKSITLDNYLLTKSRNINKQ